MWCDVMWCLPVEVRGLLEETFASILILRTAFIDWGGVKLLLFVTKTRCVYCDLEKIYFLSHNLHWVPHFKKIQTAFNRYFFVLHAAVKKIFTYLLLDPTALWGPWPPTITNAHSSLSTAFCHHLCHLHHPLVLRHIFQPSQSISSLVLLSSDLFSNILLILLHWSILATCSVHSHLFFVTSAVISRPSHSSLNSCIHVVILPHIPCSTTGPIILNNFLSHLLSFRTSISLTTYISLSYTATRFTFLYNPIWTLTLDLNIWLRP